MPGINATIENFEALATILAREIANHLGVDCGDAQFEGVAFAGTCAPFYPKKKGTALPAAI